MIGRDKTEVWMILAMIVCLGGQAVCTVLLVLSLFN